MRQSTAVPAVTETPPPDVLAVLTLPSLDRLTEEQVRGGCCVWGGEPLSTATAVDLGPRTGRRLGQPFQWFPRADRRCLARAAQQALYDHHVPRCAGCETVRGGCAVHRALCRLVREGQR
ncbi:hypothetical protein ACFOOM_10950 [Streptomyces echinoruber]|uniref:Uncharacterized protein n=1 Tax=Streptomyces echinoruber TaxID=68898 RepID=A0A918RW11_9ACTN|nr:hypothetical protein [Streptomyces echinoruber]GHA14735.1 hypothetical protein GCM10010389_61820 [Streptomyces echinoruber]